MYRDTVHLEAFEQHDHWMHHGSIAHVSKYKPMTNRVGLDHLSNIGARGYKINDQNGICVRFPLQKKKTKRVGVGHLGNIGTVRVRMRKHKVTLHAMST